MMSTEQTKIENPPPETEGEKLEQPPTMVDNALKAASQLEIAVQAMKEQNDRADKRFALQQLGGKSEAGKPPEEPKEETAAEYTARIMSGDNSVKKADS